MDTRQTGPLLDDEKFFRECVNLDYPGLEAVRECVGLGSLKEARKAFAAYIRASLDPDRFFQIPYEVPENIYKLPGETDEQACERICRHTLVSVGVPMEYGEGAAVDWEANPTYNGYKEWTWQLSRHNDIKLLAHEYRRTHRDRLARTAAELMDSWLKQAIFPGDCPGYRTKCWRTIECGIRMGANWPYILHTFYQTEYFTDDLLVDWYKSVWEHGIRLSRNHMTGNWLIMEMNGLAQISILYPQFKKSPEWGRQAFDSLAEELDRQIYPDGFQYELTTTYHNVVVNNYQRLIETANVFGVPVPESILIRLEKACELDVKLMMPNRTTPDINDGVLRSVPDTFADRERILPESKIIKWITRGDEEGRPDYTSVALPWSGFAVMRTGWTPKDSWVLFDGAPFGRAHQHEDKLSVLLYANGRLLLTEAGNYAYDSSGMRAYVLSARAHNTVRVDGMDQNRRKNYQWHDEDIRKKADLIWKFSPQWDYCESNYTEGYGEDASKDVRHNRRIFFYRGSKGRQPFLVVVDRMSASKEHEYEWLWHIDSETEPADGRLVRCRGVDVAASCGQAQIVKGLEGEQWQGFLATGTGQGMYRAIPCICVRRHGTAVRMVTVLAPYQGKESRLSDVSAPDDPDRDEIEITFDDESVFAFSESELIV